MQLHLYLPDDLASEVRRRAEARGVSVSRFLGELVRREVGGGWPPDYFDRIVGGWAGTPLERPSQGEVEKRRAL